MKIEVSNFVYNCSLPLSLINYKWLIEVIIIGKKNIWAVKRCYKYRKE